ncbi:D-alanyl-D-alanine carboxypeptidase DacB [Paenibacillus larvae subsp. larvae]|uniref:D-alanyl-D-alanine carboxypeptidase DacB n=1 Tax=Paenibacillus larvae subsp. larvae TaxID=147375 RepID=A0A2L1UDN3_9BACL|nr:D-alanyl-D-alanine carboxypeptidase family protein [Paenibacillus larvae]AQT86600.1 D-alanyl-D-alanine carboxypeptidase [Paenibacillus larvae subsp. pulvifaciens]AVF26262.1 D-alanyl-D-alanine carboxypeptidase DacB [Paenibacillus larvae subsp. larvae]AVF31039.1 D-alanyl-D-alanine carboxypeptidase DacB [Paenibacillus larvae subsp. larvae]MBH0343770.1 D-Ala-D-Ala carboxypeptidase [Paenibacillus larvae]MCY7519014.1 D-alanyl-D-alanine carboxypeptidase [Paenibacillus larvae]
MKRKKKKRGFGLILLVCILMGGAWAAANWGHSKTLAKSAWNYVTTSSSNRSFALNEIAGEAAFVMDLDSGETLFYKNENKKMYPASTTKILSALVALEKGNPNDVITVGDEVNLKTAGESSAGLVQGQKLKLRDLIAGMMLPSGNDAARTVSRYVANRDKGKNISADEANVYFAGLMNKKAKEIGATKSHFVNSHGLHDPEHYSTVHDMALIAKEAMKNELFRNIVSKESYTTAVAKPAQTYVNRNKLLLQDNPVYYSGVNGIKTGFTDEAGYCLVSSARKNGKNLISVVFHSGRDNVWTDSQKLLDYGFDKLMVQK